MKKNKKEKKEIPKIKRREGRPTKYSDELALYICNRIATSIDAIHKMCREDEKLPSFETIRAWRHEKPEFSAMYVKAKQDQAEYYVEEIMAIAHDNSQDRISTEKGIVPNPEFIARSKLKIDTIKWIACKLIPKVYGDRVTHDGSVVHTHEMALKKLRELS